MEYHWNGSCFYLVFGKVGEEMGWVMFLRFLREELLKAAALLIILIALLVR